MASYMLGWFHGHSSTEIGTFHARLKRRVVSGFRYRNLCIEAWRATFEIERPQSIGARVLRAIPDALLARLNRIIPTLIYRIAPLDEL